MVNSPQKPFVNQQKQNKPFDQQVADQKRINQQNQSSPRVPQRAQTVSGPSASRVNDKRDFSRQRQVDYKSFEDQRTSEQIAIDNRILAQMGVDLRLIEMRKHGVSQGKHLAYTLQMNDENNALVLAELASLAKLLTDNGYQMTSAESASFVQAQAILTTIKDVNNGIVTVTAPVVITNADGSITTTTTNADGTTSVATTPASGITPSPVGTPSSLPGTSTGNPVNNAGNPTGSVGSTSGLTVVSSVTNADGSVTNTMSNGSTQVVPSTKEVSF